MKKMTKLLSVILAFVMALSCMTMMASAAKSQYQTVANLESYAEGSAYSPYGTVTRLSTEVRMSMIFDALDDLLEPMTSLNMGELFKLTSNLRLSVNLTSVNNILGTIDNLKSLLNNFAVTLVKWMLGIVQYVDVSTWQTGMTRENTSQLTIAFELFELIGNNRSLVERLLTDGISLGVANSALPDMSGINNLVKDIPSAIKGVVFSMFGRPDDTQTERNKYSNKSNDLITLANEFIKGLFTKPMNWTSYRVDATGADLGYTTALPTEVGVTSRYFVINEDGSITQYDYQYAGLMGTPEPGYVETVTYTLSTEEEYEGSGTYLYKAPEGYEGDQTLKWYKADGKVDANGRIQSSYWLPKVKAAFDSGALSIDINGTDSVLGLIYQFIPYIFSEMAPTILNGSAKKLIAEAFDVQFTKIGLKGSAAVAAEASATGNPGNFFTKDQDYYVWEYSDYKVIDGVPYYRFQDTYFKGEIPNNISAYYSMFNWNWNVSDDFFNEFIPTTVGETWAVDSINNIVKKAIDTMIADEWTVKGVTYTRDEVFNWQAGGNDKLLNNLMVCARAFFNIAPEEIVDEYVEEAQFYNAMMNGTMSQAVNGLVCELVKLLMPQIVFPDNIVDQPITAIAAIVARELCTQLMPTYNFDAMIYANYGDSSNKTRALLSGKSADYWLDTTLYIGVNLGMYYLRNLTDIGEDSDLGYYAVMKNLGALPASATADAITFTATSQYVGGTAAWLYQVDWIVDWALSGETMWCWRFGNFVPADGVSLATYENPLNKIDTVLNKLLPLDQFINVDNNATCVYGSNTFIERVLKNGIVDSIVNLDLVSLLNLVKKSDGYLTKGNIADSLVQIIAKLLNGIFYNLAGNKDLVPSSVQTVNALLNQNNLKTIIGNLVEAFTPAYNNGLLDTVLPIANFFVGWITDAQQYADASIYLDRGYIQLAGGTGTATLKLKNSAKGMLLKHRGSNVYDGSNWVAEDNSYFLNIENIESTDPNMTFSKTSISNIAPGQPDEVTITTTSDKTPCVIKVTYHIVGKSGEKLGESKTQNIYTYASSTVTDIGVDGASQTGIQKKWAANIAVNYDVSLSTNNLLVKDPNKLASAIETLSVTLSNQRDANCDITSITYAGFDSSIISVNNAAISDAQGSGKLQKNSSVTVNVASPVTTFDLDSLVSGVSTFNLGNVKTSVYGSYLTTKGNADSNNLYFGSLYFINRYELDELYEEELQNARVAADYTTATWATYENAMIELAAFYYEPVTVATFPSYTDEVIAAKMAQLESAIKGLKKSSKSTSSAPLEAALDAAEALDNTTDNDLNFQNYSLFEYFKYENMRTAARKIIKEYNKPTSPNPYIENDSASYDIIEAVINATSGNVKAGIQATLTDPSEEDLRAYSEALNAWTAPQYTATEIEDNAEKVTAYRSYLITKAADKAFLNKEIAYAEAQGYVADDYSTDSWSRYTDALAKAKAVAADGSVLQSEVFDAKYELMVAQTKLQLKERSMKAVGYMEEELIPLIQAANAIIDNFGTLYTTKSTITDADAFAQLVRALGVEYDVEIDGKDYSGILYDRSALTFSEYDRTATVKNKKAIDAAADKLREAIENFECTAKLVAAEGTQVEVEQGVRYVKGVHPNSVPTEDALLAKVNVSGATGAVAEVTVSKSGHYGTGTRIDVVKNDILLASYFVVIDGDVNGDGAVDAFDAIEVDVANHTVYYMGDVYDDAADLNNDGIVDASDYSSLTALVMCTGA